jgi:hypothetical protein
VCCAEDEWRERGLEALRSVSVRSLELAKVFDAGLCHGAAGLAHLLNRVYQSTGDRILGEGAKVWFARSLSMMEKRDNSGGILFWVDEPLVWRADRTLLNGATGLMLALTAAVSNVAPMWDRMFGLMPPSEPGARRS